LGNFVRGLAGASALILAVSSQANAAAGALGFDQRAGFFSPADFTVAGLNLNFVNPTGAGFPASTFFDLNWEGSSDPGDPSALNIQVYTSSNSPTRFNAGQGDTNSDGEWDNSEWFTISRLTQTNNVIELGGIPLWTIQARSNLSVFTDPTLLTSIGTDSNSVPIDFNETPNSAPCNDGPSNPHGTECDDFYRVLTSDLTNPVLNIPLGGGLFLDLTFRLQPGPGVILQTNGNSTYAFTAEDAPGTSQLDIQVHWDIRRQVPLPGSLMLLGLGLGGAAAFRLRRKGAKS
jgi:hypothetical protein